MPPSYAVSLSDFKPALAGVEESFVDRLRRSRTARLASSVGNIESTAEVFKKIVEEFMSTSRPATNVKEVSSSFWRSFYAMRNALVLVRGSGILSDIAEERVESILLETRKSYFDVQKTLRLRFMSPNLERKPELAEFCKLSSVRMIWLGRFMLEQFTAHYGHHPFELSDGEWTVDHRPNEAHFETTGVKSDQPDALRGDCRASAGSSV